MFLMKNGSPRHAYPYNRIVVYSSLASLYFFTLDKTLPSI